MLWDGHRVPFTLLGGYLGAGKTTLLNRAIQRADGRSLVVLVNDIGAIDVDAALIVDHDGATLSLANGCVCCAIADDFAQTLETVRSMPAPPDQVLMELSGVAKPGRVAPWANTAGFRLDGVVVVVDANQIAEQLARTDIGDTVLAQLDAADTIVLTKTDLVGDAGARARALVGMLTDAPIRDAGSLPPSLLLGIARTPMGANPGPLDDAGDDYEVGAIEFDGGTRAELDRILDGLSPQVIRAKGIVQCDDGVPLEVHVVGRRRDVRVRVDLADDPTMGHLVTIAVRPG